MHSCSKAVLLLAVYAGSRESVAHQGGLPAHARTGHDVTRTHGAVHVIVDHRGEADLEEKAANMHFDSISEDGSALLAVESDGNVTTIAIGHPSHLQIAMDGPTIGKYPTAESVALISSHHSATRVKEHGPKPIFVILIVLLSLGGVVCLACIALTLTSMANEEGPSPGQSASLDSPREQPYRR